MSVMDVVIKWLSPDYPLHEIILVRSLVALVLTLAVIQFEGGLGLLKTQRPMLHVIRGLMVAAASMTFYMALAVMPIAEASALFYIAPLLITGLSVPLLGENVGWRRWLAISVGFAGVILMSGIGTSSFKVASLLPMIAALAYALTQLLTRKLGVTDKASVMTFYISVVFIIISVGFGLICGDGGFAGSAGDELQFLLRPWRLPDLYSLLLMVVCGVLVTVVFIMLAQAYRVSEANVIAPFEYVVLPLAILWGYLFWNEIPAPKTLIGIVLIGGAGLYVFIHEHSLQKHESVSTA
ncbi:MAG TPA: DMT family transporter [Rhizobiales bacterium]|nr:DMT family transporter [Hyphomicrobiales bacterium]